MILEAGGQKADNAGMPFLACGNDNRRSGPACEILLAWGAERLYKKTCSVFRGNVGAELDAMLDAAGAESAVVVAAFPANGRTTRGGIHHVRGVPLDQSEFARDPIHPRTESNLVADLARQTARPLRLLEIGASAGLNLRWDRYCYSAPNASSGDRRSPVRFDVASRRRRSD